MGERWLGRSIIQTFLQKGNTMKLAELKRQLRVGRQCKLVRHDWLRADKPNFYLGIIRTVEKANTVGVVWSEGSHLHFPKASCVRATPNGFEIALVPDFLAVMGYEFVQVESQC